MAIDGVYKSMLLCIFSSLILFLFTYNIINNTYRIASYPPRLRIVGAPYTIPGIIWNIPMSQVVCASLSGLVWQVRSPQISPSRYGRSSKFNKQCL